MSEGIVVRKCAGIEEFQRCVDLQREIWGEKDLEVEPATLFVVAAETGGQVLGAFDGERLVGYTLAVVGFRDGTVFLHSHMTGVHGDYRDRGVGRALKLFQREEALGRGAELVVWTFDPLETRNAHFNLNRLGAIARKYLPNLYGLTTSPLHLGLPTDRLWAEWQLDSGACVGKKPVSVGGELDAVSSAATIELPAELDRWKKSDPGEVAKVQARIREEFTGWFARGYAAGGVRKSSVGTAIIWLRGAILVRAGEGKPSPTASYLRESSSTEESCGLGVLREGHFARGRKKVKGTMRIREAALRELRMKLVAPFETSVERTDERRIILTEIVTDGAIGWGECVAGEKPSYSPETTDTAWIVMRDFLWPMIKGQEIRGRS